MPHVGRRSLLSAGALLLLSSTARTAPAPGFRVFKNIGCTCCDAWADHLRKAGFSAMVSSLPDLTFIRQEARVPDDLAGCHTAFVEELVVEGHVPAAAIAAFLANPSQWHGIAVPGMPVGSPGMEVAGQQAEGYTIWAFDTAGHRRVFAHAKGAQIRLA